MLRFQATPTMTSWWLRVRTIVYVLIFSGIVSIFASSAAFAIDASWSADGNEIIVNNQSYVKEQVNPVPANDTRKQGGKTAFSYESETGDTKKIHTIFVDNPNKDAPSTTGTLISFTVRPDGSYTGASSSESITIKPTSGASTAGQGGGTCIAGVGDGLGWILCPVSRWLSNVVDQIYKIIVNFLYVEPFTKSDSSVFALWGIVLSIANAFFVIIFLVIVYSQLTGTGISNYGIKAILPRIIMGAVLANLSYWICALMVDISNVLGYSIQAIVTDIEKSMKLDTSGLSWTSLTTYLLSGGVAAAGVAYAAVTFAGDIPALFFLALSFLIGAAFSVLVGFIILAARQALVIIMVAISPLAMIAFILPSTKNLFDKWQKAFVTLLLFFPLFSLLFGGSQLAGGAIISKADGRIHMMLIGLAVQFIPLVLTPLIIRFSTGILGQVANITNNSAKGPLDRFKNWSDGMADYHRTKALAKPHTARNAMLNPIGGLARELEMRKKAREQKKKSYEDKAYAQYANSKHGKRADQMARDAADDKQIAENKLDSAASQRNLTSAVHKARAQELYNSRHAADKEKKLVEDTASKAHSEHILHDTAQQAQEIAYANASKMAEQEHKKVEATVNKGVSKRQIEDLQAIEGRLDLRKREQEAKIVEDRIAALDDQIVSANGDEKKIKKVLDNNIDLMTRATLQIDPHTGRPLNSIDPGAISATSLAQTSTDLSKGGAIEFATSMAKSTATSDQNLNVAKYLTSDKDQHNPQSVITMTGNSQSVDIRKYASGFDPVANEATVIASAKATISEDYGKKVKNFENTISYEDRADFNYLQRKVLDATASQPERDAHLKILAQSGAAGHGMAVDAIKEIEKRTLQTMETNARDSQAYKAAENEYNEIREIVTYNRDLRDGNKAVDTWVNQTTVYGEGHPRQGNPVTLEDTMAYNTKNWSGLTTSQFAAQKAPAQEAYINALLRSGSDNDKRKLEKIASELIKNEKMRVDIKDDIVKKLITYERSDDNGQPIYTINDLDAERNIVLANDNSQRQQGQPPVPRTIPIDIREPRDQR